MANFNIPKGTQETPFKVAAESKEKEKPRILKKTEKHDGGSTWETKHEYDDKGRLTKTVTDVYPAEEIEKAKKDAKATKEGTWTQYGGKYSPEANHHIEEAFTYDDQGRLEMSYREWTFKGKRDRWSGKSDKQIRTSAMVYGYEGDSDKPKSIEIESAIGGSTHEMEYDEKGRLIREAVIGEEFDTEQGKMTKHERGAKTYEYDDRGRRAMERWVEDISTGRGSWHKDIYKGDRLIKTERGYLGNEDEPYGETVLEYSDGGRKVTETNYYGKDRQPIWRQTTKFDQYGNKVEYLHENLDKLTTPHQRRIRYEYEYAK